MLPCGAKVILRSGNEQVLTEVIDNALVEPGRQLEVTDALAKKLGIDGTVELQWRFATASGSCKDRPAAAVADGRADASRPRSTLCVATAHT